MEQDMIFSLCTSETTRTELQPATQLWLAAGPSNGSYHSLRGFCNTQHILRQSTRHVSQFSSDKKTWCCVAMKNKEIALKEVKAAEQWTPLSSTAAFLNWPSLFPGFSDSSRPQTAYGAARCPFFQECRLLLPTSWPSREGHLAAAISAALTSVWRRTKAE